MRTRGLANRCSIRRAAREFIDMFGCTAGEDEGKTWRRKKDSMLVDLLGKLKMTYLEISKAMAAQMAQVQGGDEREREGKK